MQKLRFRYVTRAGENYLENIYLHNLERTGQYNQKAIYMECTHKILEHKKFIFKCVD